MAKPLTKAEAVAKANAIKLANPDFPPAKIKAIIEKQNGPLVFDGEPFYFKPTGKGKLAIESVAVRNARKRRANSTRNREIRRRTPTQREFIDRSKTFFEENNLQRLDGKTARQYGIDQHRQAKEALKVEKTRISDTGLSAGHIDPVAGGNTLERPGNYFAQPGQENFADRNRVPTSRQQKALQTRLPREQAIDRTMGFGQDLPKFTDQQVDATLKGKGAPLGGVRQTVSVPSVSGNRGVIGFRNLLKTLPLPAVANRLDAIQTGVDLFTQGQTGSELDQAVQEPFAKVQDPFEAAAEARRRGGKLTVGTVTLPDFGLSEFFMPPRQ
jgi:hypothetical protein